MDNTIKELLEEHAEDAKRIYSFCIANNLQNTQEFMDWQDTLNSVSYVHKEDL